jgi:hypothetical protein
LTASEQKLVSQLQNQRNRLACKTDEGYCDQSVLSSAAVKQVAEAERTGVQSLAIEYQPTSPESKWEEAFVLSADWREFYP